MFKKWNTKHRLLYSLGVQSHQESDRGADADGEGGFVGIEVRGMKGLFGGSGAPGAQEEVEAGNFLGVEGEVFASQDRAHPDEGLWP